MKPMLSLMLAALLAMSGCSASREAAASRLAIGAGGGPAPAVLTRTLAEPVYPEFPKQPDMPETGGQEAWEAYDEAYGKYMDALMAIRGTDAPNLTQEEREALTAFAARSTTLVLAGYEGENTVYSPLSLWSALAMLAQCAGGDSRRQVLDAVGTDSVDSLQEAVSRIWRVLYTDDGRSSLLLANSIWLNDAFQGAYVQDTLDALAGQYYAGAYSVPMGTGEADQAVTDWVKRQTNGLIGGGQPVVRTKEETLALLASSLYYRAAWTDEFAAAMTEQDIFTDPFGRESRVDFMHKGERGSFLRREGYQAASLNTHLGEMVFVLPDEGVSPEALLQDPDFLVKLDVCGADSRRGEVQWSVPKFDADSDLDLMEALKSLGITDLLDRNKADLSALTDLNAFVSEARQLARVKVDEEGVEAAAVTMIMANTECAPSELNPEVCIMDLDRPFLFVIRTQGVPLFVGVVNKV